MTTMADIAERAGVALSTVSYVLSGKRSVSEETRQRVFQVIADLDYQPNVLARGLASKRSKTIALLFPALGSGYSEMGLEFVTSATRFATQCDYAFLLSTAPDKDSEMLYLMQQGRVDGLILMEIRLRDSRVALLKARNYPFSMIGHCEDNSGLHFVDFDFDHAAYTAVAHLAELGHRRIALLNHPAEVLESGYGPAVRTLRGFERAIEAFGLIGLPCVCEHALDQVQSMTAALLAQYPDLTAAVVNTETALVGLQRALYHAHLRLPDDFSLVGLLSSHVVDMMTPSVTAVDFPVADIGRMGAEILIQQLEAGIDQPVQRLMRGELVIRQSSGPRRVHLIS